MSRPIVWFTRVCKVGLALFCLVIAVVILFIGSIVFQNKIYARKYFSNFVTYEKVLASRKWHPLIGSEAIDCTYAVVSLKEGATLSPPATWFGTVTWSQSPVYLASPTHLSDRSNPVSACAEMNIWPSDLAAKLQTAVKEPGSYYYHSGESLLVYSAPQKIAAVVRYGD